MRGNGRARKKALAMGICIFLCSGKTGCFPSQKGMEESQRGSYPETAVSEKKSRQN